MKIRVDIHLVLPDLSYEVSMLDVGGATICTARAPNIVDAVERAILACRTSKHPDASTAATAFQAWVDVAYPARAGAQA